MILTCQSILILTRRSIRFKEMLNYFSKGVKIKNYNTSETYLSTATKESIVKIKLFLNSDDLIKRDTDNIINIYEIIRKYSSKNCELLKYPRVFNLKTSTIENRANVLLECGFHIVEPTHILLFLTLIKKETISSLKQKELILDNVNVQGRLVKCLSGWPTYPAMVERKDDTTATLYVTRMRVLSRYLELKIDLPIDEFERKVVSFPRIKHRPLKVLDKLLYIYQSQLRINNEKIKAHFGMLEADPQNVENILNHVPYIGGMEVRDAIRKRFIIVNSNYESIMKIQNLLDSHGISKETQKRCVGIFSLSYETVKKRLIEVKESEEYKHFLHHPRFLKLVFNKNTADKRLELLKNLNKTCKSLNVLSSSSKHYQAYANSQGDKTHGRDITMIVNSLLKDRFTLKQIHEALNRHPYFIKIPPQNIQTVYNIIKDKFTTNEIFSCCQILLYPPKLVSKYLEILLRLKDNSSTANAIDRTTLKHVCGLSFDEIDFKTISNVNVLDLTMYTLEKSYHFSGNAIWNLTSATSNSEPSLSP